MNRKDLGHLCAPVALVAKWRIGNAHTSPTASPPSPLEAKASTGSQDWRLLDFVVLDTRDPTSVPKERWEGEEGTTVVGAPDNTPKKEVSASCNDQIHQRAKVAG